MIKYLLVGTVLFVGLAFGAYKTYAEVKSDSLPIETKDKKILIAYFSHTGNTKKVAELIHKKIGGDIFEIKAEGTYPDEYRATTEQVKKELQENFRPELTTSVENMEQYDIIFLGSPVWWGTITPQVSSFLETYDLSGKTVIPFITHGGGGKGNTVKDMTAQCKNCLMIQQPWVSFKGWTFGISGWLEDLGFKK